MRSTKMRVHIGASRLHRWLALVIGVQLLLWFTSGLVMSLLPIERVRGEHLVDREAGGVLPAQTYAPLDRIAAGTPLRSARHRLLLGRPVVELETASGELRLHDAATGARIPAVDAAAAGRIASAAYKGRPRPGVRVARVTTASTEYKGRLPAWQITFADAEETRVYVQRVLAYSWIYASRLNLPTPSLEALARGAFPRFVGAEELLAQAGRRGASLH